MAQGPAHYETVIYEGADAIARLMELRIPDTGVFRQAVVSGLTARFSRSANAPRTAAGYDQWSVSVETLREALSLAAWLRVDDGNLPRIVSPDGAMAITIMAGDPGTGRRDSTPRTARPRGPATR